MPTISPFLLRGFLRYVPRYLRRHFSTVRLALGTAPELPPERSVICYANHASWWDPLIAFLLNQRFFDGRSAYLPIDAQALAQYPLFRRLGFYGVDLGSMHGAREFLGVSRRLLVRADTCLWITPSGRFADVRQRTEFQPGLAHLASSVDDVVLQPLALEYTFWDERTPEALVEFGEACRSGRHLSKSQWQQFLEEELAATQARLATKAIARDPAQFETLLSGTAGVGGFYDWLRRTRRMLSGQRFHARHGVTGERE